MNKNPGETPNPLNPNPMAGPTPTPAPQPKPVSNTVANPAINQPVTEEAVNAVTVESLAPTNRPMEKAASVVEQPKKKKTGLIAGIIAAVAVLLIGGIVAAVVVIMMNQTDPVTAAMRKIMSGEAPANVAIDGDINIAVNDEFSPISNVKINLDSSMITSSMINDSKAEITATIRNVGDLTVEFDEVYAGDGDLYFKIDGASSALQDSGVLYLLNLANQMPSEVDCGEDGYCQTEELQAITCAEGETQCEELEISDTDMNILGDGAQNMLDEDTLAYFASLLDMVEVIDGEWLRVSVDELNTLPGGETNDSDISCITGLVSSINTNSNSAAELYNKYPFISSTNKDVAITSKNYPVYRVSIDSEIFANYVNSIQNSSLASGLYSCLGWENNVQVSEDDAAKIVAEMPTVYAEVDNDNNFSRLYLNYDLNDEEVNITIDLGFSYPSAVNVSEITEYKDFSEILQEIFSSMYELPTATDEVVVETVDN